jgi:hypothetical protein
VTQLDPLDRVWAAAERLRGRARGGYRSFDQSIEQYAELLAAIAATRSLPVRDVARAARLRPATIRDLRRRAP